MQFHNTTLQTFRLYLRRAKIEYRNEEGVCCGSVSVWTLPKSYAFKIIGGAENSLGFGVMGLLCIKGFLPISCKKELSVYQNK